MAISRSSESGDPGFRSREPGLLCLSCTLEYPGKSTECVCVWEWRGVNFPGKTRPLLPIKRKVIMSVSVGGGNGLKQLFLCGTRCFELRACC